jgi:hypothetical protein
MAPSLDDVRMTVEGPSDAVISYPNDGTSSGLVRGLDWVRARQTPPGSDSTRRR